jgi:hypothetical protein
MKDVDRTFTGQKKTSRLSPLLKFQEAEKHSISPLSVIDPPVPPSLLPGSCFERCLGNNCRFLSDTRPSHVFSEPKAPGTIPNGRSRLNAGRSRHFGHSCSRLPGPSIVGSKVSRTSDLRERPRSGHRISKSAKTEVWRSSFLIEAPQLTQDEEYHDGT